MHAGNVGCRLDLTEVPDHAVVADADPRRVARILRNFVHNAIDHSEGRCIEVALAADDETVAVRVRDHGVGLRPGDEKRVFERFWRADAARAPHHRRYRAGVVDRARGRAPARWPYRRVRRTRQRRRVPPRSCRAGPARPRARHRCGCGAAPNERPHRTGAAGEQSAAPSLRGRCSAAGSIAALLAVGACAGLPHPHRWSDNRDRMIMQSASARYVGPGCMVRRIWIPTVPGPACRSTATCGIPPWGRRLGPLPVRPLGSGKTGMAGLG